MSTLTVSEPHATKPQPDLQVGARRSRRRTPWVGMAAAMMGLLLVYGCWQVFHLTPRQRSLFGDLWFFPVVIAAAWAAWRASKRCAGERRLRSGWLLIALAMVESLGAEIAQTVYELNGNRPYPSVADVLFLLFYVMLFAGVLKLGTRRRGDRDRVGLGLDLAIVAIGGAAAVWYVALGPTALAQSPSLLQAAFSIAYPVGDLVLLVGLASVLMRESAPSTRRALRFMAVGLVLYVAGDLVYGYITLHGTYHGGDPVDSFYMVAIAFFAMAGAAQKAEVAAHSAPAPVRRASWAPYLATGFGFAILLASQRNQAFFPDLSVAVTAVVLATLVSSRQYLAQRALLRTQGVLAHQSMHDVLTDLPNRALVHDRAEQMLARAERRGTPAAALYVDIDGFKHVNDSSGHAAGDELLMVVAERLRSVVRGGDTVGRMGGDEFVVLIEDSTLGAGPELVAQRLLDVLRQPIELATADGRTVAVTASVGIALAAGVPADELLRDADYALYEAKAKGKNRYVSFESDMHAAAVDRLALEADMSGALERQELFLLYQPTFDIRSKAITGVEALLRWRHPLRGTLSPETFIGIAEQTGLIVPIGRWVLGTACEQAASWQRNGHELDVAVNLSARQLDDDALVEDVHEALEASGLLPRRLTLEITETALMRDAPTAAHRLDSLKALGVRVAIDDFGTGYSSLAYLRQFPVDALKIDRSFIAGIEHSSQSKALIHMLVQLGKELGIDVLGEGIEEPAQLEELQRQQCDLGQGFLFARPLEPDAVEGFLLDRSSGRLVRQTAQARR
jgi:diguanylate cyclase (GGDEF)-like protein